MKSLYKAIDILRLGFFSLRVHAVRSVLTSLGIIIGVAGVIVMLAINEGTSRKAQESLRELGSDNIIIESVKPPKQTSGASDSTRGVLAYGLTRRDVITLQSNIPGVKRCVVTHRTRKYAHYGAKSLTVTLIATEPSYKHVARTDVRGRFISNLDMIPPAAHCVLTESLARRLFAPEDPLGKNLSVAGKAFTVVGILPQLPATLSGGEGGSDDCILIPLPTDRSVFGLYTIIAEQGSFSGEKVEVSQIILQMESEQAVLAGAAIAENVLARQHEGRDYNIKVPLKLIQEQAEQQFFWNVMFFIIAAVSLVVGGIGIMNIMLASVTERTREIGVRRALGAKRRDITVQFLIEAVTLTVVGGLIGIGVGYVLPPLVAGPLDIEPVVSTFTLVVPFLLAVGVGLVSGLYPALRAAKLDPIEALRHE